MGRALTALGAVAVFAAGAGVGALVSSGDAPSDPGGGDRPMALPDDAVMAGALQSFDACDDFLGHVRERALQMVGPHGLGGGGGDFPAGEEFAADDGATDRDGAAESTQGGGDAAAPTPNAGTTPDDVSGTNVQEAGVDEPDRVKTDGEIAYVLTDRHLRVLDVTADDPEQLAHLDLADGGWGAEMLLDGDRLLVTSYGGIAVPFAGERIAGDSWFGGSTTTITSVDVSDPTEPVVTERLTLDGATLSARMVDGVARVVIRTEPGADLAWTYPETGGIRAERNAEEANRTLIERSDADDWLPYYVHETAAGAEDEGLLLDCEQVAQPSEFAGLGILSVLTIDVADGDLRPDGAGVGVLAGGDTVYASPDRLFVATQRWIDPVVFDQAARSGDTPDELDDVTTELHGFDISDPRGTTYLASGSVPGTLLSQWSMSEHDGVLRVASTIGDTWWWGGGGDESSSLVTTFAIPDGDGDELEQLGQVTDLGPTERIYAVRFIGDVGYVVTFRQVDPLYVLDLSDPAAPEATGELKIPGYSAYLHPLGDGLLLGVGQDADEDTGMTNGAQVSLFDVSDPADPQRIDHLTVPNGYSDVEYDHRAFLHWAATGLNVVPVSRWFDDPDDVEGPPNGALAFTADRDGLAGIAGEPDELVLTHADPVDTDGSEEDLWRSYDAAWQATIWRSVVIGDRLLTFSSAGVVVHDLEDLSTRGELDY